MVGDINKETKQVHLKKPEWLKVKLPDAYDYSRLKNKLSTNKLHTICESGQCPNLGECWKSGTATFMILGDICTRSCKFCAVKTGKPLPPDFDEPDRIASTVKEMNLKHCVITSVDRDDLEDGGAEIWAKTVNAIRKINKNVTIECLVPDFYGNWNNLQKVIETHPEIISHNLETVRRLTKEVRVNARYDLSLKVIKAISESGITSKSGIMLGLGESNEEVIETMDDLLSVGCKIFTIGQYLQPGKNNYAVKKYISPDTFTEYKIIGLKKGFKYVESGPLVRSSYHAELHL